jgi:DME family drug/metabolite transporter
LGGAALAAFAVLTSLISREKAPAMSEGLGGNIRVPVAVAAVGVALYQPLFFAGVSLSGVSVGTVVAIGSAPVMAGLVGLAVLGERPGVLWTAATALAIAGCVLLLGSGGSGGSNGAGEISALGVASALGAGLCYGSYATASKTLLNRGLSQSSVMALAFGLGGALLAPALFFVELDWLAEPSGLAVALHLGLIATAAAYLLFARGLSGLPVATAATLSLAEPLTAGALGFLLLGERLGPVALLGAGLLLGGLLVARNR